MSTPFNNVFRFVSLRGPVDGETISTHSITAYVEKLIAVEADPKNPDERIAAIVADHPPMKKSDIEKSSARALKAAANSLKVVTLTSLSQLKVIVDKETLSLEELIGSSQFKNEMLALADSWVSLRLSQALKRKSMIKASYDEDETFIDVATVEDLLRMGKLCQKVVMNRNALRAPGRVAQALEARIVYPRELREGAHRRKKIIASRRTRAEEKQDELEELTEQSAKLAEAHRRYQELADDIKCLESIQIKVMRLNGQLLNAAWRKVRFESPFREAVHPGIRQRISSYLFGRKDKMATVGNPQTTINPQVKIETPMMNQAFKAQLEPLLTDSEKQTLASYENRLFADSTLTVEDSVWTFSVVLWGVIVLANDACKDIRVWEDESEAPQSSTPAQIVTEANRPSVRAIGFGDLIVARERLLDYEAHEIAHIENVLGGEERLREHERMQSEEIITEAERIEETTSEKDVQTTDRFELQVQSQKTIKEDFSIEAGLDISAKYGFVKLNASLDVEFSRSTEQSNSSSSSFAKEVVSKAIDKTYEKVREFRRRTVLEQIRELNRHVVNNVGGSSFSGIYRWVEKRHEVELRHYGTRLMVEFYVPEPGLSLLPLNNRTTQAFRKPAPLSIGPSDINASNFLCLAELYGATDVESPPPLYIHVDYGWASSVNEDANDHGQETKTDTISIPDGYIPEKTHATFSSYSARYEVSMFLAINGENIISTKSSGFETIHQFSDPRPAPQGLAVTIRESGGRDNTAVVNLRILCLRSEARQQAWQLATYERIKEAHHRVVREYEQKLAAAQIGEGIRIEGRHPDENRATEIEELKKWAIKILRASAGIVTFDFDAVVNMRDEQEVDPVISDEHAPIVRFFEEAFEWRQMSFFLYPYFWGRRNSYGYRRGLKDSDPLHQQFLKSGAARVIVSMTPGYEERILHYIEAADAEIDRINWVPPENAEPPYDIPVSEAEDTWIEVLMNKNKDVQLGSGTLSVTNGSDIVAVNEDSLWTPDYRDLQREVFIIGDTYSITEVLADRSFRIDSPYRGPDDASASYAAGSVRIGSPWEVRIPTSLVILNDQIDDL